MKNILITIVFLLITQNLFAEVAIIANNKANISDIDEAVIVAMISNEYATLTSKDIVNHGRIKSLLEYHDQNIVTVVEELDVEEYILLEMIALDTRYVISAQLKNRDHNLVHKVKMVALDYDDMIPVANRMILALHERKDVDETSNIDNVTGFETEIPKRKYVEAIHGIKLGITMPFHEDHKFNGAINIDYNLKIDTRRMLIEVGSGWMFSGVEYDGNLGYGGMTFEAGCNYMLSPEKMNSPYIGGGIMIRSLLDPYDNISGAPYFQFGVLMMRNSKVKIALNLRLAQNILPINFRDYGYWSDNEIDEDVTIYPTEVVFGFSIGW